MAILPVLTVLPSWSVPEPSAPVVPISGKACTLWVKIFTGAEKLFAVLASQKGIASAETGFTLMPTWPLPVVFWIWFSKTSDIRLIVAGIMSDRISVDAVPLMELFFVMIVVPVVELNTSEPPLPETTVTV